MSEVKSATEDSVRRFDWTWVVILVMVTVPLLAWFFFIPVAVISLVIACLIGTISGAASRARARARAERASREQEAQFALWKAP